MPRTIVVGDIHACYDKLISLLEVIGVGTDDRVVAVEDLITKRPNRQRAGVSGYTIRQLSGCERLVQIQADSTKSIQLGYILFLASG